MRHLPLSLLLLTLAGGLSAAEPASATAARPAPAASAATAAARSATGGVEAAAIINEDDWVFEPMVGRVDIFHDIPERLRVQRLAADKQDVPDVNASKGDPRKDMAAYAKEQADRIEKLVAARKFDDAVKTGDVAIKNLERYAGDADIEQWLKTIRAYRDQADEALTRDEAQAQFDALQLQITGILWAESGQRLVIIAGEPRALAVNDRVRDCVIITIDSDRVDFRFHWKRKRFEFPRYVGESPVATTATKSPAKQP